MATRDTLEVERIRDQIDYFLDLDDFAEAVELGDRLIEKLIRLVPQSAETKYLAGFVAYMHPNHATDKSLQHLAENALLECLRLEPSPSTAALAWLYLGHEAYDSKDYRAADERFHHCDPTVLHPYLAAKVLEMRLCNFIRRHGLDRAIEAVERFAKQVAQFDSDDLVLIELAATLAHELDRTEISPESKRRLLLASSDIDRLAKSSDWLVGIVTRAREE